MKHLEAVIFDWAGTMVDFGSRAPVQAMKEVFASQGISLSDDEIRQDMGIYKKDHIRRILRLPRVNSEWFENHGMEAVESDVENLFREFQPAQMRVLPSFAALIPGAAETAAALSALGLRIGSTTGYTRPMLNVLAAAAARAGYTPEAALCPDDVGGGRPLPWMCLTIALQFRLTALHNAIKVGDTVSDIDEGRNAGMWTVGLSRTGNEIGLSQQDLLSLAPDDLKLRTEAAAQRLKSAGANFVVESAADLPPVLEEIDRLISAGQRP